MDCSNMWVVLYNAKEKAVRVGKFEQYLAVAIEHMDSVAEMDFYPVYVCESRLEAIGYGAETVRKYSSKAFEVIQNGEV